MEGASTPCALEFAFSGALEFAFSGSQVTLMVVIFVVFISTSCFIFFKLSFLVLCSLKVARKVAISLFKCTLSFKSRPSSSFSSAKVFLFLDFLRSGVPESLEAMTLDVEEEPQNCKLESSQPPSAVPEEDAALHESGVVGLFLAESPHLFAGEPASHRKAILDRGCRIPHLGGGRGEPEAEATAAAAAAEDEGGCGCGGAGAHLGSCLSRTRSSATIPSSAIAVFTHSSFATIVAAVVRRKEPRTRYPDARRETDRRERERGREGGGFSVKMK